MDLSYSWEELYEAVLGLAQGTGTVQERLIDAFVDHLLKLKSSDLPSELQEEFTRLLEDVTWTAAQGDEEVLRAAVRAMDEEAAQNLIDRIVCTYDQIARRDPDDWFHPSGAA